MTNLQGKYIFRPDKASSYYSRAATTFMDNHNINYVPKDLNPTAVPQCRTVEDIFSILGTCVYAKNWVAKDEEALKRRIWSCLNKIPAQTVQATAMAIRKRLLKAYCSGILSVSH